MNKKLEKALAGHNAASFPAMGTKPNPVVPVNHPKPPGIPTAPKVPSAAAITFQNQKMDRKHTSIGSFEEAARETERRRSQSTTNRLDGKLKAKPLIPEKKI